MMLGDYLERCAAVPRSPGIHDCCTFPANWAVECGRPDPMQLWRGTYLTDGEAADMVAEAGDLAALFARGMEDAGIREISDPVAAGDIAIIAIGCLQTGAIYTGRRWAFVPAGRGLGFVSLDEWSLLRIWRP